MTRTIEKLSRDDELFLRFVRGLSDHERQEFLDLMLILRDNPGSGKLIGEGMRKGKQELSEIVEFVKREIAGSNLSVATGGVK